MELTITLAVYFIASMTAALTPAHRMQLASYQTPGYNRWLKHDASKELMRAAPIAGLVMTSLSSFHLPYFAAAVLVFMAILTRPRKAKKKFVFTPRAVRMLVVTAVIVAVFGLAAWRLPTGRFQTIALCIGFYGVFWWIPAANLVTMPLQNAINRGYIRDARRILAAHPDLTVVGITGSYGKTSAKTYLTHLLSATTETLMTPESYNTPMGITRTIREHLKPQHRVFVCEMGARHAGDIREDCDVVAPTHGMITSIGPQHLETFGDIETIVKTKFELIDALPPDGIAFLAGDNAWVRQEAERRGFAPCNHPSHGRRAGTCGVIAGGEATLHTPFPCRPAQAHITYGFDPQNNYYADGVTADTAGLSFDFHAPNGETARVTSKLLGRHNVENLTGALAVAHTLGVPLPKLVGACRTLEPAPHRLQLRAGEPGFTIIDDAYNANPAGAAAALDALALFAGKTKCLITPGMVELGDAEDAENRKFGVAAAVVCDSIALVGLSRTQPIAEGIESAGFDMMRCVAFATFQEALAWMRTQPGDDKVVLLENDLPDNY